MRDGGDDDDDWSLVIASVAQRSPNLGSGMEGDESVVLSDRQKALGLYDAVAKDNLAAFLGTPSGNGPGG